MPKQIAQQQLTAGGAGQLLTFSARLRPPGAGLPSSDSALQSSDSDVQSSDQGCARLMSHAAVDSSYSRHSVALHSI